MKITVTELNSRFELKNESSSLKIDHKNYQLEEHKEKDWKTKRTQSQLFMGQYQVYHHIYNGSFRVDEIEKMVYTKKLKKYGQKPPKCYEKTLHLEHLDPRKSVTFK